MVYEEYPVEEPMSMSFRIIKRTIVDYDDDSSSDTSSVSGVGNALSNFEL